MDETNDGIFLSYTYLFVSCYSVFIVVKLRPELLYSERMYYIINKFDQKGTHGITEQETIDYVSQNVIFSLFLSPSFPPLNYWSGIEVCRI